MQETIKLIVGLGNPGPHYEDTRHNVGAWFVDLLAKEQGLELKHESKFFGRTGRIRINNQDCWLLIPTTYMNKSGLSVKSLSHFYKLSPETILIAHDELDFPTGIARIKFDGGHGGHNGLRDIMHHLQTKNFFRLRIGIGHPGHKDQVTDYVLNKPSKKDNQLILNSIHNTYRVLPTFLAGDYQQAIQQLHNET